MAGGRPLAHSQSGPRYLERYDRKHIDASGARGLDMSGSRYAAQVQDNWWKDIELFTNALTGVAKTYHQIRETRDIRDTETMTDEMIRQRKLDIFSTRTGKGADNLFEEEQKWNQEMRNEVIKKSGLDAGMAGDIWDKKSRQYLDRVVSYQIEQNRVADEQSKFAAMVNFQGELAQSSVGDFRGYAEYSAKINELYGPLSKEGILAKEKGIDVLIDSWTAQSPRGTLQWFEKNKEALKEVMGREFPGVANAMERTRNKLEAQVRRAELQAQRADRINQKRQKEIDKKWQSDAITKILSDDGEFNITEVIRSGAAEGISGDTLLTIQKVFESRENVSTKKESKALRSMWQAKAAEEGLSEQDHKTLTDALANQRILAADYQAIIAADERTQKAGEEGLKELRKGAMNALRTAIAPRGALDTVNQAAEDLFVRASAELDKYVETLSSPAEKKAALDITDPKSYASLLIKLNAEGKTPIDRTKAAFSTKPYTPSKVNLPQGQARKPGETFEEWKKRTGN